MEEYKKPTPIAVNNVEVPADLQLIFEDILNAWNEGRIIGIQRNDPSLSLRPDGDGEQKILIRIKNNK